MRRVERPPLPDGPFLVAGLGRAGLAAAGALLERAPISAVHAWDASRGPRVRGAARRLRRRGVEVALRGDGLASLDLAGRGATVVKSPGIPFDSPLVAAARERGQLVIDELELGWRAGRGPVIGVTGTNGKSTTCALVRRALEGAGLEPLVVGNTEWGPPLSSAAGHEDWLVCEVSSFQLEGAPAFLPEVAVFTNLTAEHLPHHGGIEPYGAAKRRMFVRGDQAPPAAVLNVDDPFGAQLARDAARAGSRVLGYGTSPEADVRIVEADWDMRAARLRLGGSLGEHEIETRLPGEHNAHNLAAAFAAAVAAGLEPARAAGALGGAVPPPGRWQVIDEGQHFDAVVDYAHTPDGIRRALEAARAAVDARPRGEVWIVFGPVGMPDADKARESGRALAELSDRLVLTTGSAPGLPRVVRIEELMRAGHGGRARTEVVLERGAAVEHAVAAARPGDAVIVLGIGALPVLCVDARGTLCPFDDGEAVRRALRARRAVETAS